MVEEAKAAPIVHRRHDLNHLIHLLHEALQSEKRRIGFVIGAGCPLGIYDAAGEKPLCLIPDVAGLTDEVSTALAAGAEKKYLEYWQKLLKACTTHTVPKPNVEHALTQLRTICSLYGGIEIDGMTLDVLKALDREICNHIAKAVGKQLPAHPNAYLRFASWVRSIERTDPIEIFTPNYDLLLEEALEANGVPFFDGFVGSRQPFFDLVAMEQDRVPKRWTRLWKLHGSINWIKREDGSIFRGFPPPPEKQLLIYPSHLKYDQSRRLPYLAMLDRFRAFFREPHSVLVIAGYSFADEHLNEVLVEGLRGNRSAQCFALMYEPLDKCKSATNLAKQNANLSVLASDGAVIGKSEGNYQPVDASDLKAGSGLAAGGNPDEKEVVPVQCALGNFHHLALYLESQFGKADAA